VVAIIPKGAVFMQKITPFLWYLDQAEEAARFYATVFPDSRVTSVGALPGGSPGDAPGSVKVVDFELFGQPFAAMSAAGNAPFSPAISLMISCDSQAEIDRYWEALPAGGGATLDCGWLTDRFGVSWQITPRGLPGMVTDPDREKARRAANAMMTMKKLDIAALQAAYDGQAAA
jgi:predicted 3-demethylubiquinone-9 3-methyltransferase (glyoxalase superfamily)